MIPTLSEILYLVIINLCPYETTEYIYKELMNINKQLISARDRLINMARENWESILEVLKNNHLERVAKRARESWYNSECIDPNLGILQPTPLKRNEAWVKSQRKRFKQEKPILFPIERIPFYTGEIAPILIENVYKRPKRDKNISKSKSKSKKASHVFILIHGMDSRYTDLLPIMNEISLVTPNADFILPEWIAGEKSRLSIKTSGQKVAYEIIETLERDYDDLDEIGKISFVWHSLGGLIARAAFPHLQEFHCKFYSYWSLGSPHLGIHNAQAHITIGAIFTEIFSLGNWITELRLADSYSIERTNLYNLSESKGFEHFEHIYFIASAQDTYSPYYSSRVQIFKDDLELPNANMLINMNQNILNQCKNGVTRVDVNFNIQKNDFESLIGKTAHIMLLEYQPFLSVLVNRYRSTIFAE